MDVDVECWLESDDGATIQVPTIGWRVQVDMTYTLRARAPGFRLANKGTVTFTREQFWSLAAPGGATVQVNRSWSTWSPGAGDVRACVGCEQRRLHVNARAAGPARPQPGTRLASGGGPAATFLRSARFVKGPRAAQASTDHARGGPKARRLRRIAAGDRFCKCVDADGK